MALASKKTPRVVDLSNSSKKAKLQAKFDDTVYLDTVVDNPDDHPELAAILLQIQNINDDMDIIRTYAGDVKGDIPTSAITANTAKTGITSTQASAITANSTIENKTEGTISFGAPDRRTGAMTITVKVGENKFTYTIAAN
tara:strand:- start:666 stop:1088 length:423 start_codon:yes stop_codon:yes gene_type:complete